MTCQQPEHVASFFKTVGFKIQLAFVHAAHFKQIFRCQKLALCVFVKCLVIKIFSFREILLGLVKVFVCLWWWLLQLVALIIIATAVAAVAVHAVVAAAAVAAAIVSAGSAAAVVAVVV